MERVKAICADAPIFTLKPFHKKKAAIITTGNEVYHGRIEDTFTPVIREKLAEYDTEVIFHETFDDDNQKITDGCLAAIEAGADLVICTGGMSVDPDDKTPLAIKNTGGRDHFLRCTGTAGSDVSDFLLQRKCSDPWSAGLRDVCKAHNL